MALQTSDPPQHPEIKIEIFRKTDCLKYKDENSWVRNNVPVVHISEKDYRADLLVFVRKPDSTQSGRILIPADLNVMIENFQFFKEKVDEERAKNLGNTASVSRQNSNNNDQGDQDPSNLSKSAQQGDQSTSKEAAGVSSAVSSSSSHLSGSSSKNLQKITIEVVSPYPRAFAEVMGTVYDRGVNVNKKNVKSLYQVAKFLRDEPLMNSLQSYAKATLVPDMSFQISSILATFGQTFAEEILAFYKKSQLSDIEFDSFSASLEQLDWTDFSFIIGLLAQAIKDAEEDFESNSASNLQPTLTSEQYIKLQFAWIRHAKRTAENIEDLILSANYNSVANRDKFKLYNFCIDKISKENIVKIHKHIFSNIDESNFDCGSSLAFSDGQGGSGSADPTSRGIGPGGRSVRSKSATTHARTLQFVQPPPYTEHLHVHSTTSYCRKDRSTANPSTTSLLSFDERLCRLIADNTELAEAILADHYCGKKSLTSNQQTWIMVMLRQQQYENANGFAPNVFCRTRYEEELKRKNILQRYADLIESRETVNGCEAGTVAE